jgi:hypothetical protein
MRCDTLLTKLSGSSGMEKGRFLTIRLKAFIVLKYVK